MSTDPNPAPDPTPNPPSDPNPSDPAPVEDKTFTQADVDRIIQGRLSKYADYDDIKSQLGEAQKANQTESERAISEAEERGRTSASSEFGKELAQTQFDALAGRRNPEFDTAKALEFVDLGKFLGEDGRPVAQAIAAAVERLVPAPADGPPSFDGGTRTPAPAQTGMTGLIRKAAGRA